MKNIKTLFLTLLITLVYAGSAMAASTTITISTGVSDVCQILNTPTPINFTFDPSTTTPLINTAQSSFQFWCTKDTSFKVTVSNGLYPDASGNPRLKHNSGDYYIPYKIQYVPTSGTGQGASTAQTVTVTAEVRQYDVRNAMVGTYSDTITITIQPQ